MSDKDPRPTAEIIAAILAEEDEDREWDMIMSLHRRDTREVFDAAVELTRSENPDERSVGVDIIAQLGVETRSFPEETRELLFGMLECETDPGVLNSTLVGLMHNREFGGVERVVGFKDHPSESVRAGVVHALTTHEDDAAVQALIELSADEDIDVRDWATFGLAQQTDLDTPEIREALIRRLNDEEPVIRAEATAGLVRRGDGRAVDAMLEQLRDFEDSDNDFWKGTLLNAVMDSGDSRAYPLLVALKEKGVIDEWLDQAIAACRIPSPDEYQEPDDQPTTCPVCGLREVFSDSDEWQFCQRCGWSFDEHQRADPDLERGCNRWSLRQERERWQKRLSQPTE